MKAKASGYKYRLLARFVVEAETPLAIGSGEKDILTDALVAVDVNGLPYIPGTTIAGVVRSMIDCDENLFGYQKSNKGCGSEVIFSEGKILDSKGKVIDGIDPSAASDELLHHFFTLPIRQHVRITSKGTAEKGGKFDEQVVYAGTRFCFEVEILSRTGSLENLEKIMNAVHNSSFRLGGGSRNGFGKMKVVSVATQSLDLYKPTDLDLYLSKPSHLQKSSEWEGWKINETSLQNVIEAEGWTTYKLSLTPEDFFLFGAGHGDETGDADMSPVRACKVDWTTGTGSLKEGCILIPAASLKGALRHRIAYHYNKLLSRFVENGTAQEAKDCDAVKALFGYAENEQNIARGNILFHDIIESDSKVQSKYVNHVSIDRFTGGAIDGALFTEQVDYAPDHSLETSILVQQAVLEQDDNYRKALEAALKDIVSGMLPLGGGVNRGNGVFTGTITKNGEQLS